MSEALAEVDAVIHTAGIASTMSGLPEDDYRLLNTEATVGFARAAERARVKRFIFLSSIRAQAGPTCEDVLTEEGKPQPTDAYGRSKLAAERGLAETGLDWAALRLALVYGPGAQGNVARLLKLARSPYPCRSRAFGPRHSLLALDNLAEAVDRILTAAGASCAALSSSPTPNRSPSARSLLHCGTVWDAAPACSTFPGQC